jgi:hypothetical protein
MSWVLLLCDPHWTPLLAHVVAAACAASQSRISLMHSPPAQAHERLLLTHPSKANVILPVQKLLLPKRLPVVSRPAILGQAWRTVIAWQQALHSR